MRHHAMFIGVCLSALSVVNAELVISDDVGGAFVDISTTGTALGLDDEGVAEVDPGFDLTTTLFAGDGSGRVWVSNNGAVGFLGDDGSVGAFYLNTEIPNFGLFGGSHGEPQALAVYWDDLDSDTGDVYHQTIGDAGERVLIIQWQDRPHYAGDPVLDGNEATFQVQIFESGEPAHAQLAYADVDFQDPALDDGASATIGYQSNGRSNHAQWSFNTPGAVTSGTVLSVITVGDCPEDLDGDGWIGQSDLGILLASYEIDDGGDIDSDGDTDQADLGALLARYGESCD